MDRKKKLDERKGDKKLISDEKKFIIDKHGGTHTDLERREREMEDLIYRKQDRSKKEFEMKKEVLRDSFKASVDSLIKRVRK